MFEATPISSLAHKISFAVFRVSRLIRNKKLRGELKSGAVDLVKDLSEDSIGILDRLVALAEAVGEMNQVNSSVLRRELNNLHGMVSLHDARPVIQEEAVYFGDIFDPVSEKEIDAEVEKTRPKVSTNAPERQSAIVGFIRQFPDNCRMKDLNSEFADVSERTLRNDIQFLIENRLVERLGGKSGPSSYFVVVDKNERSGDSLPDKILLPETTQF